MDNIFYFTMTPYQVDFHIGDRNAHLDTGARGFGCIRVRADSWGQARNKMMSAFGQKWSAQYSKLSDVHALDRKILGSLP